jgi:glycosyltransferase involved in cell wall biosynthesis
MLIHIFGRPHIAAAFAARAAGVRRVAASAGNPPPDVTNVRRRWSAILIASRMLRCPVMSCSNAVEAALLGLGRGLPAGSARISNAIDIDAIASRVAIAREPRSEPKFVIGMVARLNRIKDHETLLRAFSLLRSTRTDAELWIVGDGPLRGILEERAMRLGISAPTRFLGERTDVPRLLAQMDVFAFSTTRDEGFGIALIEAMAAGVPIVASDVAGCREVLANGKAGVLVPPADGQALAKALDDLLKNSEQRRLQIENARRHVRQEYSIERCAAKWEKLLFRSPDVNDIASSTCAS